MKTNHIVRAWKDENYRSNLSQSEKSLMPENPVGQIELSDSDLRRVTGGQAADTCICGTKVIDSCVKPPVQCP
jgi:mersacidin/lichenicidin family type 2 lantibiotic